MKPFSKSEWIRPPACGALVPFLKHKPIISFLFLNLNEERKNVTNLNSPSFDLFRARSEKVH
jgi:hypothetical protein